MKNTGLYAVAAAFTLVVAGFSPALANNGSELSAEQIGTIFEKQKTRGLVLAPSTGTNDTAAVVAAPEATAASEPVTYTQLAADETIAVQISFDFDSAALRTDQKDKLTNLCAAMQTADVGVFRIIGHTDASGSASYNERLSLLRAQEVKRHMVTECGIPEAKLEAIGVGEEFPANTANPRADENRRVEFQALS